MRRSLIIASLAGSFGILTLTSGVFEHLFMFVLFGMLPGSNEPLSASAMLALWGLVLTGVCSLSAVNISRRFEGVLGLSRQDRTA